MAKKPIEQNFFKGSNEYTNGYPSAFLAQPVKQEFTKHLVTTDCYSWLLQLSYTLTNIIGYLNWLIKLISTNHYIVLLTLT